MLEINDDFLQAEVRFNCGTYVSNVNKNVGNDESGDPYLQS